MGQNISSKQFSRKEEIENLLSRCLYEIYQLKSDVRHVEITLHCGRSSGETDGTSITYWETELDTPISNGVTYLLRGASGEIKH